MICYNEAERLFHLQTAHSSYCFGLLTDAVPVHLYWGARLEEPLRLHQLLQGRERSFSPADVGVDALSSDALPLEYPCYGSGDFRRPALHVQYADGSRITKLNYVNHTIADGKPPLEGLPATWAEPGDAVQTLTVLLRDELTGLEAALQYSVFETLDAITRSVRLVNGGREPVVLRTALSASLDMQGGQLELLHLPGTWARERIPQRLPLMQGRMSAESLRGSSSAHHNPFLALLEPETTERQGRVWAMNLVYSGNFEAAAELDALGQTRMSIGLQPFDFAWTLTPGAAFQTPEAVLVCAEHGLGELSRRYHRLYRTRLCRGQYRDTPRPVLLNNWEATYFDFDQEKLLAIARTAAACGLDLMVLDDGWFGRRNDDHSSLGDWSVNRAKLPEGLDGLARRINGLGLRFGLWVEPEMISEDSELYRAHPDWCIHVPGRPRTPSRHQLVLDLSRPVVCDWLIETMSGVLCSANISYLKWDMNRNITDLWTPSLPPARQGEQAHRYMLGLYRVLETLTARFPAVLFESCSGGGGRFDPGMLYYMPQTWTSDDTDALERLRIQYGTSLCYPYSAMGCHVSAVPNHQVGRVTPLQLRGHVAMPGQLGYELDLNHLTAEERGQVRAQAAQYRALERVFHTGELFRLTPPDPTEPMGLEFRSEDGNTIVLLIYVNRATPNAPYRWLRLEGLDPAAQYRDETGTVYSGSVLMQKGIPVECSGDGWSSLRVYSRLGAC